MLAYGPSLVNFYPFKVRKQSFNQTDYKGDHLHQAVLQILLFESQSNLRYKQFKGGAGDILEPLFPNIVKKPGTILCTGLY